MPSNLHNQGTDGTGAPLEEWLNQELRFAATAMQRSVSATHLARERKAFGQSITPNRGSILASPEIANYDPDPDYFFHWLRDSALVMDAMREAMRAGLIGHEGHAHFADFIRFSLSLTDASTTRARLDRNSVDAQYQQFLRPDSELYETSPDSLLAETRFNPDGSRDILKWARPQADGPALRAMTIMRYWPLCPPDDIETKRLLEQLIRQDLAFVARHCRSPSFDLWEEELGENYYTRLVQLGALTYGLGWYRNVDGATEPANVRKLIDELSTELYRYWSATEGIYLAQAPSAAQFQNKNPNIAIVLGALHARLATGAHSIFDPKVQATLAKLEATFATSLALNRMAGREQAPVLGRYPGDVYYGGGAWHLATLAAAELYFRLASGIASGQAFIRTRENEAFYARAAHGLVKESRQSMAGQAADNAALAFFARGDALLATFRRFVPPSGELSEQVDRETGKPASAKNLAWSYAAFITACQARRSAITEIGMLSP